MSKAELNEWDEIFAARVLRGIADAAVRGVLHSSLAASSFVKQNSQWQFTGRTPPGW